jgi:hypothetical protein
MTEAEWLEGDPLRMLLHLRRTKVAIRQRRMRLFGCACCRRIWRLIPEAWAAAVEASERQADGEATVRDVEGVRLPYPADASVAGLKRCTELGDLVR